MLSVAEEPNPPAPFPTQEGGERMEMDVFLPFSPRFP